MRLDNYLFIGTITTLSKNSRNIRNKNNTTHRQVMI